MDINILLALQEFRNGAGAFLADFLSKMTFLGELNSVIVIMAVVYWCVNKDFGTYLFMGWGGNRLVKGRIPGAAGTIVSCFLQLFYIAFLFPWYMKHFEKSEA